MDDETADQEYIHEPSIDMRTNEKKVPVHCSAVSNQDLKISKFLRTQLNRIYPSPGS